MLILLQRKFLRSLLKSNKTPFPVLYLLMKVHKTPLKTKKMIFTGVSKEQLVGPNVNHRHNMVIKAVVPSAAAGDSTDGAGDSSGRAGCLIGDQIVEINGHSISKVTNVGEITTFLKDHDNTITVRRNPQKSECKETIVYPPIPSQDLDITILPKDKDKFDKYEVHHNEETFSFHSPYKFLLKNTDGRGRVDDEEDFDRMMDTTMVRVDDEILAINGKHISEFPSLQQVDEGIGYCFYKGIPMKLKVHRVFPAPKTTEQYNQQLLYMQNKFKNHVTELEGKVKSLEMQLEQQRQQQQQQQRQQQQRQVPIDQYNALKVEHDKQKNSCISLVNDLGNLSRFSAKESSIATCYQHMLSKLIRTAIDCQEHLVKLRPRPPSPIIDTKEAVAIITNNPPSFEREGIMYHPFIRQAPPMDSKVDVLEGIPYWTSEATAAAAAMNQPVRGSNASSGGFGAASNPSAAGTNATATKAAAAPPPYGPGFSFGAPPLGSKAAAAAAPPPSGGFSFGCPPQGSTAAGFSFGGPPLFSKAAAAPLFSKAAAARLKAAAATADTNGTATEAAAADTNGTATEAAAPPAALATSATKANDPPGFTLCAPQAGDSDLLSSPPPSQRKQGPGQERTRLADLHKSQKTTNAATAATTATNEGAENTNPGGNDAVDDKMNGDSSPNDNTASATTTVGEDDMGETEPDGRKLPRASTMVWGDFMATSANGGKRKEREESDDDDKEDVEEQENKAARLTLDDDAASKSTRVTQSKVTNQPPGPVDDDDDGDDQLPGPTDDGDDDDNDGFPDNDVHSDGGNEDDDVDCDDQEGFGDGGTSNEDGDMDYNEINLRGIKYKTIGDFEDYFEGTGKYLNQPVPGGVKALKDKLTGNKLSNARKMERIVQRIQQHPTRKEDWDKKISKKASVAKGGGVSLDTILRVVENKK